MCEYCSVASNWYVYNSQRTKKIFARKTCAVHLNKAVSDTIETYGSGPVTVERMG